MKIITEKGPMSAAEAREHVYALDAAFFAEIECYDDAARLYDSMFGDQSVSPWTRMQIIGTMVRRTMDMKGL